MHNVPRGLVKATQSPSTMTIYYLAFRPCTELIRVGQDACSPTNLVLARSGWTNPSIHGGTSGTDLMSFASNLSSEAQRMGSDINKCLSTRTSSFLLLLTSGGLVLYLLFRYTNWCDSDLQRLKKYSK